MSNEKVGKIELDVVANTAQHDSALKQSEQAAESFAKTAEKAGESTKNAGEKMVEGMKKASHEVHGVAKAFEKFIGIPGMLLGVATAFYEIGSTISEYVIKALETGTERAHEFLETLQAKKATEQLSAITDKVAKLNTELAKAQNDESMFGVAMGRSSTKIREEITELARRAKDLKVSTSRDDERKQVEELEKRTRELRKEGMTEQERAAADAEDKMAELRKRKVGENQKELQRAIEEQIEAEYRARDEKTRQLNEDQAQKDWEDLDKRMTEEENRTQELHAEKAKMQSALLEGEKKMRFDLEQQLAELQRRLNKETDAARRKDLQDMMKLAADEFGKQMAQQMQAVIDKWTQVQQDSQSQLNFTLTQCLQEVRTIRGTL